MKESELWQKLKSHLDTTSAFYSRIETSTVSGVPDLYVAISCDGFWWSGWIELKALESLPAQGKLRIPHYKRLQQRWLFNNEKNGGNSVLLVGTPERCLWLFGVDAVVANELSVAEACRRSRGSRLEDFPMNLLPKKNGPVRGGSWPKIGGECHDE